MPSTVRKYILLCKLLVVIFPATWHSTGIWQYVIESIVLLTVSIDSIMITYEIKVTFSQFNTYSDSTVKNNHIRSYFM